MAFFRNDSPFEEPANDSKANPAEDHSHSARSKPLFKQDTGLPNALAGQHISLSAYISQHLNGNADEESQASSNSPAMSPGSLHFPTPETNAPAGMEGQYLNSLDVELAAGLEQYLPTPLFRLRVMKKRLDDDITELTQRLQKYERLPMKSPDMKQRMAAVQARLATLEAHNRQVTQDLQTALTYGPFLYEVSRLYQGVSRFFATGANWLNRHLTRWLYGKTYVEFAQSQAEVQSMQELMQERLQDKQVSGEEISQILNRYEQAVHQAESSSRQLKSVSFSRRMWQEVRGLVE